MKSCLLVCLLCGALPICAADAVPVDAATHQEVSTPDDVLLKQGYFEPSIQEVIKTAVDGAPYLQRQHLAPNAQDAANPNSNCPRGWHLYQENCFLFMNLSYTWNNADAMCQSIGASLASVHDMWEYNFLKQLTWRAGFLTAWIGGYRFQGFWKWDDGTPFDYNNWYQSSSYECVFLNSPESSGWSSATCSNLHPFICSIKLNAC
ncbi:hypothetical protein NQD34_000591 [Periophthalmus magnuspinnatus]|uniref:ladderlectin-like n=1 Tax=Periophthalmus magnuspinnatus TaxID=409849 RepID=UPI00145A198C|nr:ladderlectin-like [Periophthalmus magnuspinnatus]KAJ0033484.1 hypothetical protein NQD34_000591 [Periophthalmus magnuspinnatus]